MVLILEGNMLRTHEGKSVFSEKLVTAVNNIQMPYTDQITENAACALIPKLTPDLSTMLHILFIENQFCIT